MSDVTTLKYIVINSLIGEIIIVWEDSTNIIKQIILPDHNTKKTSYGNINYHGVLLEEHPNKYIVNLISRIKEAVLGKDITFDINRMDLSELTEFQQSVLRKQHEIPYGFATSYKQLALLINKPRSARPIANVLSSNPFPILIPCHRTVLSNWKLGGYVGITNNSFKQFLLEREGVKITDGQIDEKYRYIIEE